MNIKKTSLTIINDKNLRGVLAPKKFLSKELLEDIIDFIELSSPELIKESEERVTEANHNKSWMSLREVRKLAKEAE